jgi:hypothetical protein
MKLVMDTQPAQPLKRPSIDRHSAFLLEATIAMRHKRPSIDRHSAFLLESPKSQIAMPRPQMKPTNALPSLTAVVAQMDLRQGLEATTSTSKGFQPFILRLIPLILRHLVATQTTHQMLRPSLLGLMIREAALKSAALEQLLEANWLGKMLSLAGYTALLAPALA